MSEYKERDIPELGLEKHYVRHVNAMTKEKLHSKGDIAAELAWRDQEIERLQGMEEAFFKSAKTIESLQSQLAAVEKERDELKEELEFLELNYRDVDDETLTLDAQLIKYKLLSKSLTQKLADAEERADKVKFNAKLLEALAFYADPNTYFAIGFLPDPPNGEFMGDFSVTELGQKPGKLAREVLEWDKCPQKNQKNWQSGRRSFLGRVR